MNAFPARPTDQAEAWAFLGQAKDEDIPLVWAALTIARDEYPDLDVAAYEAQLAEYGQRARAQTVDAEGAVGQVRAINNLMFDELGFSGNQQDYYDPRNSYLNDVLDRKLGIPISLAVLQLDIAQRAGVPMQGISFPGHFLVSLPVDGGLLVLDPFHRGRSVDADELKLRAKPHLGDAELRDEQLSELLVPASNRAILTRMLRNLKTLYVEREDWERALRCTARLLTVDANQPGEVRDRGLLYLRIGHAEAAREDLKHYLALRPQADDIDQVREALIRCSRERARVN